MVDLRVLSPVLTAHHDLKCGVFSLGCQVTRLSELALDFLHVTSFVFGTKGHQMVCLSKNWGKDKGCRRLQVVLECCWDGGGVFGFQSNLVRSFSLFCESATSITWKCLLMISATVGSVRVQLSLFLKSVDFSLPGTRNPKCFRVCWLWVL